MSTPAGPDFTGNRVCHYWKWLQHSKFLCEVKRVFNQRGQQYKQFTQYCPKSINKDSVSKLVDIFNRDDYVGLFQQAKQFQKDLVRHWNPHVGKVTCCLEANPISKKSKLCFTNSPMKLLEVSILPAHWCSRTLVI